MLAYLFACATAAPSKAPDPPPPPPPEGTTLTLRVPHPCPHLIVDVLSAERADVTVACFDAASNRIFFDHREGEPVGARQGTGEDVLVVRFASDERSRQTAVSP